MIRALRVAGAVLAAVSVLLVAGGTVFGTRLLLEEVDSAGLVVLLVGGAATWLWQAFEGAALSLLCFAAARLLEASGVPPRT